jgi:mRNA-degrading endonuclease toxin of MazEF toxin-antitoxin module
MTEANRGNVVLIRYQRTGQEKPWLRPALVLSSQAYQQGRDELLLAAITSSPVLPQPGDTAVQRWSDAGLLGPSLVTGVLFTTLPTSVERVLGTLTDVEMRGVEDNLRRNLVL